MEESIRVGIMLIIACFLFSETVATNTTINAFMREEYNSKIIQKGSTDYYDSVVIDADTGELINMYTYQQMMLSFANQGAMMPCHHLEFNGKYITKRTAKTISTRTISKQLDFSGDGSSIENTRFILMKEVNDMVWYQVPMDKISSIAGGTYGRDIIYVYRNPAYLNESNSDAKDAPNPGNTPKYLFGTSDDVFVNHSR